MTRWLAPRASRISKGVLRRAVYAGTPLFTYLLLTGCSSGELDNTGSGGGEESVGSISSALKLTGSATASSVLGGNTASMAVDGNTGTRWESVHAVDPQWLTIDLGSQKTFNRVLLNWEGAYGKAYTIQQSNDNTNWTTLKTETAGNGGIDDHTGLNGNARYVRMHGTQRGTQWGYSLWEMEVHAADCVPTTCAALGATCGTPSNGCGGTLSCGTCSGGQTCSGSFQCTGGSSCASNDLTTATNLGVTTSSGTGGAAFDNNVGTRWESAHGVDPQWIRVDLGATKHINRVRIDWEAANAKNYTVEVSNDGSNFTTIATKTNMPGGNHRIDDLTGLSGQGRYVRIHGTARNLTYGYSIWEMDVFGDNNASCGGSPPPPSNEPCGGTCTTGQTCNLSNVCVTESCGGNCAMGQKCVNNACVNDTSTGAGYYNSGKSLETVPSGFFGPNFKLYDHNSNQTTIANEITAAYNAQRGGNGVNPDGQFGTRRDAFMFLPGTYSAQLDIGFNTQIAGLADHPDPVVLNGRIMAMPPANMGNNGTQTFWRFLENFKSGYTATNNIWAVSQAAPMRRVHALGEISLHLDWGWQSGGFISDSVFDYKLHFGSQQQFYVRNSHAATAQAGVWNIMLHGVSGSRVDLATFPTGPLTELGSVPVIREKPFLYVNRDGLFKVFVPALRTNVSGASWTSGPQAGTSIALSKFHIVKPGSDPNADMAPAINTALSQGKHVLFTPGIYFIDSPLAVNNANTVLLGIGLATITPRNGVNAINVADVDGVKLAGLLIDAGSATSSTASSHTLVQVGPSGSSANHSSNPTSIHDLFVRVGGRTWTGKAQRSLVINSHNTLIDHIWMWRADHGPGVGWADNTAANGLIVNGNNVTSYATHVEHFQEYQVMWNGNNGRNYFFQNEIAYEAPNQNAFDNPDFYDLDGNSGTPLTPLISNTGHGYASYKVAPGVTNHEFYAGGCYAVFLMNACTTGSQCASGVCGTDGNCTAPNPIMEADKCIETPTGAGIVFRNLLAQTLSDKGKINNLFNTDGRAAAPGMPYPKVAVP